MAAGVDAATMKPHTSDECVRTTESVAQGEEKVETVLLLLLLLLFYCAS